MKSNRTSSRACQWVCCALLCGTARVGFSQREPSAPPIPLKDASGKTGAFQVILEERSPLSKLSEVAARTGIAAKQDYDLSKERFTIYMPKEAGADGKYGVMVSLHFREYGWPALAWPEVLEKYHFIWVGPQNTGEGRDNAQRIGLVLDAVYNAQKAWPIDPSRVYLCVSTPEPPGCGIDLEYPDVFQGGLHSIGWNWIGPVRVTKGATGAMWNPHKQWLKRPDPKLWNLAKTRRFFCADRIGEQHNGQDANADFATEGFMKSGFKHVKCISVPDEKMPHYVNYAADWFEEGIQFLDSVRSDTAPQAADAAKPEPSTDMKKATGPSSPATPPPAASSASAADERSATAQRGLSLAKSYIAAQNYETARAKLQKVIADYPDTPPAKEAASLLNDIKDK